MNYALILDFDENNKFNKTNSISIFGKPLLDYLIDNVEKTNFYKTIYITETISSDSLHVIDKQQFIKRLKEMLREDGTTIILPSNKPLIDNVLLEDLLDFHNENGQELTIGSVISDEPISCGRIIKKDNSIIKIVGEKNLTEEQKIIKEVDGGIYCIKNHRLLEILLNDIDLKHLIKPSKIIENFAGKIGSFIIRDVYKLDSIDNYYQLVKIEDNLRKKINQGHILNGIYLENLETITIGPDVVIESNCKIRSGSIIFGKSIIKSGAIIGPNSEINDSYIGENSVVMQSVVNLSSIGKNAKIGPFSHLRMNSLIGDDDRIGNFVEIKNSSIGKKTNVSHLTYVGDTDCGNGVNFGCGVVTVNYNGKNKFKTTIGNNVFIGCNSNLIAPIKIENGAFIAAGSTITEDMDVDDFAISRVEQITKKGYARKYGYMKFFNKEDSKKSNLKD